MSHKMYWFFGLAFVLGVAWFVHADDPTSKFLLLPPLASNLAPSSSGLAVQLEIRDQATGGTLIYSEAHTVDTDEGSNITNDTGFGDLLLGRPGGLDASNFPAGSSRYLDVTQGGSSLTQGGSSVLPVCLPLYALAAFSLSPGPQGPPGPKGDKGDKGDPGPPGPQGPSLALIWP